MLQTKVQQQWQQSQLGNHHRRRLVVMSHLKSQHSRPRSQPSSEVKINLGAEGEGPEEADPGRSPALEEEVIRIKIRTEAAEEEVANLRHAHGVQSTQTMHQQGPVTSIIPEAGELGFVQTPPHVLGLTSLLQDLQQIQTEKLASLKYKK